MSTDPASADQRHEAGTRMPAREDGAATLQVRDLTMSYGGRTVLDGVSFDVRPGRITGFLGPNGAGKSTTFRAIMGLDRPTAGKVVVDGRPLDGWVNPGRKIAAVLGNHAAHRRRTAVDHLRWVGQLVGADQKDCLAALNRVGLAKAAKSRAGTFSLGMQQRLSLATALLGDPEIILLDEPMNGLDPEGIEWLKGMLGALRSEGRTVFVASHLLKETEDIVDDLVIIAHGQVVHASTMQEFVERYERSVVHVTCDDPERMAQAVTEAGGHIVGQLGGPRLTCEGIDVERVGGLARGLELTVYELSAVRDLSRAYHTATQGRTEIRGEEVR